MRIFDHEPSPPHSVLKLFIDLFSNDVTAGLFYTNDVFVLIDIILRQLYDMFPGDKVLKDIQNFIINIEKTYNFLFYSVDNIWNYVEEYYVRRAIMNINIVQKIS